MSRTPQAPMFVREMGLPVRLTLYLVFGLGLMVADQRLDALSLLRSSMMALLHPMQAQLARPFQFFGEASDFFVIHGDLMADNRKLSQERDALLQSMQSWRSLELENTRLRDLLALPPRPEVASLAAEIIRTQPDPFARRVVVNRGEKDGVLPGRPVVDPHGLVGQVTRVYPTSSEVTLLVSKEQSAPVMNARNGLRLIVSGVGSDDLLEVRYLDMQADLKAGDLLATSGIDGVYPAGIPVARVLRLEMPSHTPFARAVCAPLAQTGQYQHVLILQPRPGLAAPVPPVPAAPSPEQRDAG